MLRGKHHGLQPHRPVVLVAQGDLAFRVRPQPGQLAALAHLRLALHQAMRQGDGRRHQHIGFVGGVAEHQALVARALLAFILAIHALRDVRRLLADDIENAAAGAVEPHIRGVVADVQHGLAHQRFDIHPRTGRDLARDDHDAGLPPAFRRPRARRGSAPCACRRAARMASRTASEDLVRDLIGVAFGDRFGRE